MQPSLNKPLPIALLATVFAWACSACHDVAHLPATAGFGPNPTLPTPDPPLIPTLNIAPAKGWPDAATPIAAPGTTVHALAQGLDHPRWLYVLPNGDVLVAETEAPYKPDDSKGVKGWITKTVMKKAGAADHSANRITLLRDANGDGVPRLQSVFLDHLNSPFGVALVGNDLYVANTDAIVRYPYKDGETKITEPGTTLTPLPGGPIDHHWTKSLVASPDGSLLYVGVGSNSNITENGMEAEKPTAPRFWKSIAQPAAFVFSRAACAIPMA
jgi:glucose/arabinose dehydrogenase